MGSVIAGVALAALASVLFNVAIVLQASEAREVPDEHGLRVSLIGLAPLVLRRSIGADSIAVVLGAGFAFALGAFCAKIVADAIDREAWLAVVLVVGVAALAAFVGTLTEQTALQRRQATQVAPIIFAVELLVPVALAVLVVGEDWEKESAF